MAENMDQIPNSTETAQTSDLLARMSLSDDKPALATSTTTALTPDPPFDEDAIVAACLNSATVRQFKPPKLEKISHAFLRYSPDTIIKFGYSVSIEETSNQTFAHRVLDPLIVRVPKIHHFFERGGEAENDYCGFIVMEYIESEPCQRNPSPEEARKIAAAMDHMHSIRSNVPGPVGGGWTSGRPLWEEGTLYLNNTRDLETYWNIRLFDANGRVIKSKIWLHEDRKLEPLNFRGEGRLVLTHCDINHQNVKFCKQDGVPVLLNWSSAGFYPRTFELVSSDLARVFREALAPLSDEERAECEKLNLAMWNAMTIHWSAFPEPPYFEPGDETSDWRTLLGIPEATKD